MTRLAFALLLASSLAACGQPAQSDAAQSDAAQSEAAPPEVAEPWTRDTVGRTDSAAVFMTITAPAADRLLGASTPIAGDTSLMTMTGGSEAMAMADVAAIDLPAGQPVTLGPTGLHVWLAGLDHPLTAGETFPLTLEFENAGTREVTVSVIAPAAAAPMGGMKM